MTKQKLLLFTLSAAILVGSFVAPSNADNINHRQLHQNRAINRGVANGRINANEHSYLKHNQQHIERVERRDRIDGGRYTKRERLNTHRMLNNQHKRIVHARHNRW